MNEVLNAIHSRRSTRGFTNEPLTQEQRQTLIDAALASPSARNTQMWHFSFVQDKAVLDQFRSFMAEKTGRADMDPFYGAPTAIFISRPAECENRFVDVDCGIACQNIVLAAQSLGLGSVIIGMVIEAFLSDHGAEFAKAVDMPEGHQFAVAIVVGHNTVTKEAHPVGENKVSIIE